MNCNIRNAVRLYCDKKGKWALDEMLNNAVEMMARVKTGDLSAVDEFTTLYCLDEEVTGYIKAKKLGLQEDET